MTRSVNPFCTSHRARRYNVAALMFVLCAWLVAAATHLHVKEQDAGIADSAHCAFCFALSVNAAPAPELRIPTVIVAPSVIVAFDETTVDGRTVPSFYFSRGPPAA